MRTVTCRVTVYFDDPFWAMLYERESGGWYEANRTVFGAEPKDYEVYAFLLQNWKQLRFSPPVQAGEQARRPDNPKRRQRAARKAVEPAGTGTKAQQALAAHIDLAGPHVVAVVVADHLHDPADDDIGDALAHVVRVLDLGAGHGHGLGKVVVVYLIQAHIDEFGEPFP